MPSAGPRFPGTAVAKGAGGDPQHPQRKIGPQEGPQTQFLKTPADIAVYGGAAGGGKTWALLMEPLRHIQNPAFSAVIFRRTFPQIRNEGGLWDESGTLYPLLGAEPKTSDFEWMFPSGATVRFAHMQHEKNKLDWQGAQIPLMEFDELTHFSEDQFFYVALSRGRTMSGVRPYVRAATNPDAASWVKKFLAPWVDSSSPIKAESGEILWMLRHEGVIQWYRSPEEAPEDFRDELISVTFIAASVYDNEIMLKENPQYLARLKALPPVERARLLDGDWDAVPTAGKVFNKTWTPIVQDYPPRPMVEIIRSYGTRQETEWIEDPYAAYSLVRFWDFAGTEKELETDNPDFTVGCKMLRHGDNYTVLHIVRGQVAAGEVEQLVYDTAVADGPDCAVRWEIEGGSAGKILASSLMRKLRKFNAAGIRPQGNKLRRFRPFAQAAQAGGVSILEAPWNDAYLNELHHFPDKPWKRDQVDATSGAYTYLSLHGAEVTEGPDLFSEDIQEQLNYMQHERSYRVATSESLRALEEWAS